MLSSVDERAEEILKFFEDNKYALNIVSSAYGFAKEKHGRQVRKDGTPYILHPVEVALILANLGFDEDVVCGALLHDVIEDCNCTKEQLAEEFNPKIAELVDAVSAIDKAKFVLNPDDIYEDANFVKSSIEEQSFKKLIAIGKKNPLGFCIKFADRLHNLRTIECFEQSKQIEKVKETEKWIIPIAKILNTEYFYRSLKNECFKILNREHGQGFFEQYNTYHALNQENIDTLAKRLQEVFSNSAIKEIKIKNVREYKVFEDLSEMYKTINISQVSQGQILKVTNYNIYLLYAGKNHKPVVEEALHLLNTKLSFIKIIDAKVGTFTKKAFFQLQDNYKNKYNLYILSNADYITLRNGSLSGQNEILDEEDADNLDAELIKVKAMSGETKFIAKDSTVLDFAFKIHKELGLGFKYAIVNGSKTKCPPYTKIYEGDQVEIVVDRNENGKIKINADIRWLAYVNTPLAKRELIKYFSKFVREK